MCDGSAAQLTTIDDDNATSHYRVWMLIDVRRGGFEHNDRRSSRYWYACAGHNLLSNVWETYEYNFFFCLVAQAGVGVVAAAAVETDTRTRKE